MTVLLVEDNPNDAELTIRSLRKNNLASTIDLVRDGAEALEYLLCEGAYASRDRSQRPRLVLLDLKLPKLSGIEVLKRIRKEADYVTLPIVVMSSSAEDRDIKDAYLHGVNSYIVKPVEFEAFSAAVTQAGMYWMLLNNAPKE